MDDGRQSVHFGMRRTDALNHTYTANIRMRPLRSTDNVRTGIDLSICPDTNP